MPITDTMNTSLQRRRGSQHGFSLIEVMLALIVFTMMTLMFAAVIPIALASSKSANNYAQAALLAQHKIDQLRAAGVGSLDYADLTSKGIIDTMSTPPSPDAPPYKFTFNNADNLVNNGTNGGYFPQSSPGGTLSIVDYRAYQISKGTNNPTVPAGVMDFVTVTIAWSGGGVSNGTYSLSAIIVKMTHT